MLASSSHIFLSKINTHPYDTLALFNRSPKGSFNTVPMASLSSIMRPLGKNGPLVPRIGFGTMGMGFPCSRTTAPIPDPERLALLDRAHELGCTFWDTSDFYVRDRPKSPVQR
jgi:hypothetical protein